MKRTNELWNKPYTNYDNLKGISNMKDFNGEDLERESREAYMKKIQRQWLEEQMQEKQNRRQQEQEQERQYAQQVKEITQLRGVLETEFAMKKRQKQDEMKRQNKNYALYQQEQKQKENNQLKEEQRQEISELLARGVPKKFDGSLLRNQLNE